MINGKYEDRLCGYGPMLEFYLSRDVKLLALHEDIFTNINDAYHAVDVYVHRFEKIRHDYAEDAALHENVIEEERGLLTFRTWCSRYHDELDLIEEIIENQPLGLFLLHLDKLKASITPEPIRLLEIIKRVMPTWVLVVKLTNFSLFYANVDLRCN